MKIKKVSTCCGYYSLETGTKIILWLTVGFDILTVVLYFNGDRHYSQLDPDPSTKPKLVWFCRVNGFFCACDAVLAALTLYFVHTKKGPSWLIPFLIRCVAALISFIVVGAVLLLSAIFAEHVGGVITDELTEIATRLNNSTSGETYHFDRDFAEHATGYTRGISIGMLLYASCVFVLFSYLSIVVNSYYCQLKDESTKRRSTNGKRSSLLPDEEDAEHNSYNRSHSYAQAQSQGAPFYDKNAGSRV